jgi:fido (protein-threonine AMPylation protein)
MIRPAMSTKWIEIADLPEEWGALRDAQAEALMSAWHEQVSELEKRDHYKRFLVRLRREWAIETGVLERLYSLSEGATRTLIEQGFDAALLSRDDTDRPIGQVIALIKDQYDVIEGLYQFVSGERKLSTSYLRELHQALTAHQPTYEAVDTLGNVIERPLVPGIWKSLPNQIGTVACCPPEQVQSQIDRLLELHEKHEAQGVPPYLESAWIHHRFTLIHPFADGNGRIARCLATVILLKPRWFPLVVTRVERTEYVTALRDADRGDLGPLVRLFNRLQRLSIRRAMSLAEDVGAEYQHKAGVLAALRDRFQQVGAADKERRAQATMVADALHVIAKTAVDEIKPEIDAIVKGANLSWKAFTRHGPRDSETAHFNGMQIREAAGKLDYSVNFQKYRSWVMLVIETDYRTEILFSFHGMGHGDTGAYACSAMVYTRSPGEDGTSVLSEIQLLANEPFSFTYRELPNAVSKRFGPWVSDCLMNGLRQLGQRP